MLAFLDSSLGQGSVVVLDLSGLLFCSFEAGFSGDGFLKSKIEKAAAAVVVGIGLLAGSTGDVQAACDPPVYDVCFHKTDGDFSTDGYVKMEVDFDVPYAKRNQQYEVVWTGLMFFFDYNTGDSWTYSGSDSVTGVYGTVLSPIPVFTGTRLLLTVTTITVALSMNGIQERAAAIRWLRWIFTLINRRRTFLSTIALPFSIMSCPLITAQWTGNRNQLRCCIDIVKAIGKGLFPVAPIGIMAILARLVFIMRSLAR